MAFTDATTGYIPIDVRWALFPPLATPSSWRRALVRHYDALPLPSLPAPQNNGQGVSIQKSTDGGITWNDDETGAPFALLLLDIAAHGSNIAVVGALSLEYSLNSAVTFNTSLGPLGAGQCMRVIGDGQGFAAVGQWGLVKPSNGPAISKDFGITFEAMNIPELTADARYGAFPTADAWFIAAGDWPGEGADGEWLEWQRH